MRLESRTVATYLAAYFAALAVFLIFDILWISYVMRPIFERHVGDMLLDSPRMAAAAAFFVVYVAGLMYFASAPAAAQGVWWLAVVHGAAIGFLAYGTYELTNVATLKGWNYNMLVTDIAWGVGLSSVTSLVGYMIMSAR